MLKFPSKCQNFLCQFISYNLKWEGDAGNEAQKKKKKKKICWWQLLIIVVLFFIYTVFFQKHRFGTKNVKGQPQARTPTSSTTLGRCTEKEKTDSIVYIDAG
ncbi:hypothetical protein NE237_007380 [Protea cynaroides]|uniref:Uncharacterized protein n=1 Tax=Protea cynaroides TaxID=273540 RepID=A0A9Q0KPX6_9MAGN|nr:hypothetical protein NE237_007380 [Protea cynaroides]